MNIYEQSYDGEWIDVTETRLFVCCDCGLVHIRECRVVDDRIIQRGFRDAQATAAFRRRKTVQAKIKLLNK